MELLFDLCDEVMTQVVGYMVHVVINIGLGPQCLAIGPQEMLEILLDRFSRAPATSSSLFTLASTRSRKFTPSMTLVFIYIYI